MSFYSDLDNHGKKLYDDYIEAQNTWFTYVKPKAYKIFNDHLNEQNKKFYKFEYYTSKINMNDKKYSTDTSSDDNKKIYKLLSKKFHPDKFHKINSDKFFAKINKAIDENNTNFLESIIEKTEKILQFSDDEFTKFYESINNDDNDIELSSTLSYQFYMNKINKKDIENMYFTEDELIKEIESTYNLNFVQFCFDRYRDYENIIKACSIRMIKENEKLLEENKKLKDEIEKIRILEQINRKEI
jgi:hypothetical protein